MKTAETELMKLFVLLKARLPYRPGKPGNNTAIEQCIKFKRDASWAGGNRCAALG